MVQEHRLLADRFQETMKKMAMRGWTTFGGPALPTEKGRASGGVCILVRSHLDCWAPDDGCLQHGRAARCYIRSSELGVIMIGT
eukprot:6034392-Pyramimonas_sp.AAC.1